MTRFDYFTDIEEKFVELRGKALHLSPLDWQLIQQWKDDGVPLHIVIGAIEEVFKNHEARKSRRTISSLGYCKPEVEAQFAEWKESRVGSHDELGVPPSGGPSKDGTPNNPFPKDDVLAYLLRTQQEMVELQVKRAK